jgi:hypothetical protein
MVNKFNIRQQLVWQPEPAKKSEVRIPYEEGKILPNSPEEEIELPPFRVPYSFRQLRSIKRRQNNLKFKHKDNRRALMKELRYEEEYL